MKRTRTAEQKQLYKIVAMRLRVARAIKDLSLTQTASMIGISTEQMRKYEKCVNEIPVSRLVNLADKLGINYDFFFRRIEL